MTLADRIEQAEGPSRELDAEIFTALFPEQVPSPIVESGYGWRFDGQGWWLATGEDARTPRQTIYPPRYTASLDAAMTLVPEGCTWTVTTNTVPPSAVVWTDDVSCVDAEGATPALALCAAALRAKEQAHAD